MPKAKTKPGKPTATKRKFRPLLATRNPIRAYPVWHSRIAGGRPALVKVSWMDACGGLRPRVNLANTNWPTDDKDNIGIINQTVGYLLLYNKHWCLVAPEMSEQGEPRDITDVPSVLVLAVEELAAEVE